MKRLTHDMRRRIRGTAAALAAAALAFLFLPSATASPSAPAGSSTGLAVTVAQGRAQGEAETGYNAWLGLPYAAPPVGDLRWKAPQAPASWKGTRQATSFGDRCVQGTGWDPGYSTAKLSEDCLYLNVYAPSGARRDLPVLVWIHGGGFQGGAGQDTDPRQYVQHNDAVVVTVNYRLGALGFLNLPQLRAESPNGAGNFGLLDQQAALRWVHRNITAFGGNAGNVTIAGQSAGGSSVCDQLASPTAKGLFQKAVILSGGCSMQTAASADTSGRKVLSALGCPDTSAALGCLRGRSTSDIVAMQAAGTSAQPSLGGAAFPLDPGTAVKTGDFNRVPVVNGQTHDEQRLFVFQSYDNAGRPLTAAQYANMIRSEYGPDADKVLETYPVSAFPSPSIAFATVGSDAGSWTRKVLDDELSRWTPTYAYEFHVEDTPQFASIYLLQQKGGPAASFPFGATHVDDLPYLWQYLGMTLPMNAGQLALSDQITGFWKNFQDTGNPNGGSLPTWARYTGSSPAWMEYRACNADPSGHQLSGACSTAGTSYVQDHHLDLWAAVDGQ